MQNKKNDNSTKPKGDLVKKEIELIAFLTETFTQNSRSSIKSFLQNNKVHVNGKPISKHNHLLKIGDRVEIIKPMIFKEVKLNGLDIIFEDENIIVINKEDGLMSIAGNNKNEDNAYRILSQYVKDKNLENKIFVIHRLDKDTSGVMMYAKSQEIQEIFQKNWKDCVIERTYIVVVEGEILKESDTITSYLTENKNFMMFSSFKDNGGLLAVLNYKRIKYNNNFSLLEVNLETGRKNQIRVQMQAIGHPVVGDKKYGATTNPIRRVALHAKTLIFIHPITQKEMKFNTQTPSLFSKLV
jgi:23S rRNA pseudouridine1911/1915/1917 synthase